MLSRGLALLGLFAFSGCSHLFYQPSPALYLDPKKAHPEFHEVSFRSSDGTQLYGWFFPASSKQSPKGTVIQFHGNAENMSSHFASLAWVIDQGYNLFAFDYRGYGKSQGSPSQEGLNRDALAAIRAIVERDPRSKSRDLVLYGQSLGGAVLLRSLDDIPDRSRIRAVVVESTFDSYRAMGRDILSRSIFTWVFQPVTYLLLSDAYQPRDSIGRVSPLPLLVIHGDADPVVPVTFGQRIFELANAPKMLWLIPGGGHIDSMDVESGRYRAPLMEYLDRLPKD